MTPTKHDRPYGVALDDRPLVEQRHDFEAELRVLSEERRNAERDAFRLGTVPGGDDPAARQRVHWVDLRIRDLQRALAEVDRRIQREQAETAGILAAAAAEAEANWRASLPEPERAIHDRLTALERQLSAIVRTLRGAGYRDLPS